MKTIFLDAEWRPVKQGAAVLVKVIKDDGSIVFGVPRSKPANQNVLIRALDKLFPNAFKDHRGRPGEVGGSLARDAAGGTTPTKVDRVWKGKRETAESELSKLEAGTIGEKLAAQALKEEFGADFETMNVGKNNSPLDLAGDHMAVEVKTGMSSNGDSAQHWRATIGQPGKKESALLTKMSKEDKSAWNIRKGVLILERKNGLLNKMADEIGGTVKPMTVGVILSPDGKNADVFFVPGFHLRLPWTQYATDEYYVGTYNAK